MDRSFLRQGDESAESGLAAAVVKLGESLQLEVVAEGIEQSFQVGRLTEVGCDLGQGYYFARPMLASDCRRWVAERQPPSLAVVRPLTIKRVEGA
jgi:EAL domain-containing protein (putative c-di-GMP-specific phosphodiesterase class I)